MKKLLLPILIPSVILSCSFINNSEVTNNSSGEVKVSFKFPKKSTSFVVKAIPEETDSIEIKVLGKRLNEEATKTVKKADADPKTGEVKLNLKKLPIGEKYVEVRAYNGTKLLSSAREEVTIKAKEVVTVTLDLKPGDLPKLEVNLQGEAKKLLNGDKKPNPNGSGQPLLNGKPAPNRSGQPLLNGKPNPNGSGQPLLNGKPDPNRSGLPLLNGSPDPNRSGLPLLNGSPDPNRSGLPLLNGSPDPNRSGLPLLNGSPDPNRSGLPLLNGSPDPNRSGLPLLNGSPNPSTIASILPIISPKPSLVATPIPSPSNISPSTQATPKPPILPNKLPLK